MDKKYESLRKKINFIKKNLLYWYYLNYRSNHTEKFLLFEVFQIFVWNFLHVHIHR